MEETTNIPHEYTQAKNPILDMFSTLWQRRKVFYWLWPITFVLSAALILCVPRYYTCDVVLAPESQSGGSSGSLQALASSFGFDSRSMNGADALYPMIYPNIVSSPDFLVRLFDVPISTADGEFHDTYYRYLQKKVKRVFWKRWKSKLKRLITPETEPIQLERKKDAGVDVFYMNKWQWDAIRMMQENITCSIDKKTEVITLKVTAQDPLVCATMGDSVCTTLQAFVTDYRTKKNRIDLAYYEDVMADAYQEYKRASSNYIRYVDSHSGMNLEQYRIEAQNLETEMQIKQAAYTSFQKQYLATQARLQEETPVFTVLQSASIPLKPTGPRRMIFVLAMLILATGVAACVVCKDQLIELLMSSKDED